MSLPFYPRKYANVELYQKRNEFGVAGKKGFCVYEKWTELCSLLLCTSRNTLQLICMKI